MGFPGFVAVMLALIAVVVVAVLAQTQNLLRQGEVMAGELENLQREVAETKAAVTSVIDFIATLKARIEELIAGGATPEALAALAADLDAEQARISAVINPPPA